MEGVFLDLIFLFDLIHSAVIIKKEKSCKIFELNVPLSKLQVLNIKYLMKGTYAASLRCFVRSGCRTWKGIYCLWLL